MSKKVQIRVKTIAKKTGSGNIRVRTSVSNGRSTKASSKTIHVK